MGIRFFCDQCGKKLNIKEELAGKKGRCPKCSSVIRIPTKSVDEQTASQTNPSTTGQNPQPQPTSMTSASSAPDEPKPESTGVATAPETAQPHDAAPPPVPGTSINVDADDETETITVNRGEPAISAPPSPPNPEPTPDNSDAIAANPGCNWYVRPGSGGQFGPAEPNVMRSWLNEGRVGPDSLVWCEGWEQWQVAADVFPDELGQMSNSRDRLPKPESDVSVGNAASSKSGANRIVTHQLARKRARTMGIVLIVGLALLSIALAVILIIVVQNANNTPSEDKKESANLFMRELTNHNQFAVGKPVMPRGWRSA